MSEPGAQPHGSAVVPDFVEIYDTTLRDGSQLEGISLTVDDKLDKLLQKIINDHEEIQKLRGEMGALPVRPGEGN